MSMDWLEMGIQTIDGGKIIAKVDGAIQEVIQNIMDPNTEPKAKRGVTLKIVFKPSHDRKEADITFEVNKSLPSNAVGVDMVRFTNNGKGYVQEAEQLPLDINAVEEEFDPHTGEVLEMNGTEPGKGNMN